MSFAPYQVDYSASGKGKTFGVTKKKVVFKFGVANRQALAQGLTGANCRGSEHEVQFIWSLQSGKRQIYADNKQVHYSESGRSGFTSDRSFTFQFSMPCPGVGTMRCQLLSMPVSNEAGGNKRPFDLRVNGISYFSMCKIYELGTPNMRLAPGAGMGYNPVRDDELAASPEERRQIAAAKAASLRELGNQQQQGGGYPGGAPRPMPAREEEPNLIDFDSDPLPAAPVQPNVSGLTMDSTLQSSFGSIPPQQQPQQPPYVPPPPQQQAYSNYTLSPVQEASFGGQSYASSGAGTYSSAAPVPPQYNPYPPTTTAPAPQPWSAPPQPQWGQQLAPQYGAPVPGPAYGQQPPPFASPQSMASYGSAPSFAQPPQGGPPPPQQQPPQHPYGTSTNPW